MEVSMKSIILPLLIVGVAASGCATKKYVSREVGEVNAKVDTLTTEVEKTQERTKRNEVRIEEVNQEAQTAKGSAQQALQKATDAEKAAKGKLIYTVTLSNDKVTFPLNRAEVSDDAKAMIDEAIAQLKAENKGVFFEIEGHTDSTGPDAYNVKLGEDRAQAVRGYMHDQHGIALSRMEVISYGETKPVEDNKTREHRAQNRRVVIKVLE
jgi:outer membrane protein OmpA-like peptidoglycan-associated protein